MMNVRVRTDADLEPLEDVLRACHAQYGWPLEGLPDAKAFINDDHAPLEQAWVAEVDGQIVGHIAITAEVPCNPAVALWRAQGNTDRVAVVGRLFVHPDRTGKTRGVTRALVDAIDEWRMANDVQLIMYCVVWNAARRLMCQILTARFGWSKYGDTEYISTEGDTIPAVCCFAPPELFIPSEDTNTMLAKVRMMSNLGFWTLWSNMSIWLQRTSRWCRFSLSHVHWLSTKSGNRR